MQIVTWGYIVAQTVCLNESFWYNLSVMDKFTENNESCSISIWSFEIVRWLKTRHNADSWIGNYVIIGLVVTTEFNSLIDQTDTQKKDIPV